MQFAHVHIETARGPMDEMVTLEGARRLAKTATELSITTEVWVTTDDGLFHWQKGLGWAQVNNNLL